MGGIEFLNPAMLGALGAVAAPFIIHLLTRRRPRNWEFPSIRFLRVAVRRKSRIHRLHDLILLALRTLAVLLLVLTFARPILQQWAHAKEESAGSEVLILVDDSLSMGYQANPSPFDSARSKAIEILESLTKGDSVDLWFLTQPKPLLPSFSENLSAIESELRKAGVSEAAADIPVILESVRQFLRWEDARAPVIYILSDFQRSSWASVQPQQLAFGGRVVMMDCGVADATNRTVSAVRVRPARPAITETVAVTCQIANYGPAESETGVSFSLENKTPLRRQLVLPPYGTADVTFHLRFEQADIYRGTVRIDGDRLPTDDRRMMVFRVSDQISVLLITDAHPDDTRSGAYFLRRAIAPSETGLLRVDSLTGEEITPERLDAFDVVLISEVKLLSRNALEALQHHLQRGGKVLYFLTRTEDRGNLFGLEGLDPDDAMLPFRPEDLFDLRSFSKQSLSFAEANYESPLLRFFREPENGDLSSVRVHRFFTTKRSNELSEILLTYSDGSVALAQANAGAGILVLANFSPRSDHSDLARRNLFLPFLHEMIKGLRLPQLEAGESHPGEAVSTHIEFKDGPVAQVETIIVRDPEEKPIQALLNLSEKSASITIPRAEKSGFHSILVGGKAVEIVAVNIDPDESDLRPLPPDGLERLIQGGTGASEVRLASLSAGIREFREGRIVWPYVLLVGFLVFGLEGSLAYRWRRR